MFLMFKLSLLMKLNKKRISMCLSILFIIPTLLIGCDKKEKIAEENTQNITVEKEYGNSLQISLYYDKEKATKETLKKIVDDFSKDKDKVGDNKSIIVMFYERENEIYYSDLIPYAVGFWGSSEGFIYSNDQISTKNNNTYIEFSTEKDISISEEDDEIYDNLLEKFKPTDTTYKEFYQSVNFSLLKSETFDFPKEDIQNVLEKFKMKYQKDAIDLIKKGPLD